MNNLNARQKRILRDCVPRYENDKGYHFDKLDEKIIGKLKQIHDYETLQEDAEGYVKSQLLIRLKRLLLRIFANNGAMHVKY